MRSRWTEYRAWKREVNMDRTAIHYKMDDFERWFARKAASQEATDSRVQSLSNRVDRLATQVHYLAAMQDTSVEKYATLADVPDGTTVVDRTGALAVVESNGMETIDPDFQTTGPYVRI